jgi:hypothetical protein
VKADEQVEASMRRVRRTSDARAALSGLRSEVSDFRRDAAEEDAQHRWKQPHAPAADAPSMGRASEEGIAMKALTLTQPWATLVAIGAKTVETRSWETNYRGPLAIHAAKGYPRHCQNLIYVPSFDEALSKGGYPKHEAITRPLPLGAVVATAELIGCHQIGTDVQSGTSLFTLIDRPDAEFPFGDYRAGRWAWVLDNIKKLEHPIPAKGMLGLWEWQR